MAEYTVSLELVLHVPIKVIVNGADAGEAIDVASGLIAGNVADAAHFQSHGWKADVTIKPPKGVRLAKSNVKATLISQTSGGEKAKKLSPTG